LQNEIAMDNQRTTSHEQQLTSQSATALGVRMHGVTLTLESNHAPLIAYAAEHLNNLAGAPVKTPNLAVRCAWSQGEWEAQANPFPADGALNVIGKRMLGNDHELIWLNTLRLPGLQLRFCREGDTLIFDVAYRYHSQKIDTTPEYEYTKYFSLMSYLVYFPLIWYMENFRGWTILHASALATASGGIIIGGLGGVGKTTTCVALLQRPGITLVSENLIFTDGNFIYPCHEPIRLDAGSLAMLGEDPQGLIPMAFPEGLKKKWFFHLRTNEPSQKVKPAALFLPQFSARRFVTPITSDLAAEKLVAINRLTRELDDYSWYAAALEMHWPNIGQARSRLEVLRRFAKSVRCYELGIDRSAGVEAVVEDILGGLQ
jgi:hypothetical protein